MENKESKELSPFPEYKLNASCNHTAGMQSVYTVKHSLSPGSTSLSQHSTQKSLCSLSALEKQCSVTPSSSSSLPPLIPSISLLSHAVSVICSALSFPLRICLCHSWTCFWLASFLSHRLSPSLRSPGSEATANFWPWYLSLFVAQRGNMCSLAKPKAHKLCHNNHPVLRLVAGLPLTNPQYLWSHPPKKLDFWKKSVSLRICSACTSCLFPG